MVDLNLVLKKARRIAQQNHRKLEKVEYDQSSVDVHTVNVHGFAIYDPFLDVTTISEVDPIEEYGETAIREFVTSFEKKKQI